MDLDGETLAAKDTNAAKEYTASGRATATAAQRR